MLLRGFAHIRRQFAAMWRRRLCWSELPRRGKIRTEREEAVGEGAALPMHLGNEVAEADGGGFGGCERKGQLCRDGPMGDGEGQEHDWDPQRARYSDVQDGAQEWSSVGEDARPGGETGAGDCDNRRDEQQRSSAELKSHAQ